MPDEGRLTEQRPQVAYRMEFRSLVRSLEPQSVLDVGCGDGTTLQEVARTGIRAFGIEPDAGSLATLKGSGLEVLRGVAESLPFADRSVDLVISEYSAHHFADFERYLLEATRVARRGVITLDAWYDETILSQRSARSLDNWLKAVDRAEGQVHNEVIGAGRFIDASARRAKLSFTKRLVLAPLDLAQTLSTIAERSACKSMTDDLRKRRDELITELHENLPSEDGAVIVSALL